LNPCFEKFLIFQSTYIGVLKNDLKICEMLS
jgi:hypothetical protein